MCNKTLLVGSLETHQACNYLKIRPYTRRNYVFFFFLCRTNTRSSNTTRGRPWKLNYVTNKYK